MPKPASPSSKPAVKPRRTYHHGDLRRALLDAARALIQAEGMEALTLREVARKVGVTHAAPYHHFPTRESLLDALAEEGFALLDAEMRAAIAHDEGERGAGAARAGSDAPRAGTQRLKAIGRAYIDFARAHPDRLQVMFRRRDASRAADAPLPPGTFSHLFGAVEACQAEGSAPAGSPFALALSAWSLVHGFAKLWVEGPLEAMGPYAGSYESLRDALLDDFGASWQARAHVEARGAAPAAKKPRR